MHDSKIAVRAILKKRRERALVHVPYSLILLDVYFNSHRVPDNQSHFE